jgi:hypothetical protein
VTQNKARVSLNVHRLHVRRPTEQLRSAHPTQISDDSIHQSVLGRCVQTSSYTKLDRTVNADSANAGHRYTTWDVVIRCRSSTDKPFPHVCEPLRYAVRRISIEVSVCVLRRASTPFISRFFSHTYFGQTLACKWQGAALGSSYGPARMQEQISIRFSSLPSSRHPSEYAR